MVSNNRTSVPAVGWCFVGKTQTRSVPGSARKSRPLLERNSVDNRYISTSLDFYWCRGAAPGLQRPNVNMCTNKDHIAISNLFNRNINKFDLHFYSQQLAKSSSRSFARRMPPESGVGWFVDLVVTCCITLHTSLRRSNSNGGQCRRAKGRPCKRTQLIKPPRDFPTKSSSWNANVPL